MKYFHYLSGSDFDQCSVFTSFLLPATASVVLCSWLTWTSAPQGETSSFRDDLSCQPREDGATGQYAVWLPTCAPHAELNSLNLAFSKKKKCPSPQFQPPTPDCFSFRVVPVKALFCLVMDGCSLSRSTDRCLTWCTQIWRTWFNHHKKYIKCFVNL